MIYCVNKFASQKNEEFFLLLFILFILLFILFILKQFSSYSWKSIQTLIVK